MIVDYGRSYLDDIEKIKDKTIIRRTHTVIEKLEAANSLRNVTNIKSMQGYSGYYRIRIGDFRIGFFLENENIIMLLAVGHRSVFYRNFP